MVEASKLEFGDSNMKRPRINGEDESQCSHPVFIKMDDNGLVICPKKIDSDGNLAPVTVHDTTFDNVPVARDMVESLILPRDMKTLNELDPTQLVNFLCINSSIISIGFTLGFCQYFVQWLIHLLWRKRFRLVGRLLIYRYIKLGEEHERLQASHSVNLRRLLLCCEGGDFEVEGLAGRKQRDVAQRKAATKKEQTAMEKYKFDISI